MGKGYAEHGNGSSHSAKRPDLQTRLLFEEDPQRPPVPIPPLLGDEKTQELRGACPTQSHVQSRWLCGFGAERSRLEPHLGRLEEPTQHCRCRVFAWSTAHSLPLSAPENLP